MSVLDEIVTASLPVIPDVLVRTVGRRYVAGDTLEDAIVTVRDLAGQGASATVDVLGEEVAEVEVALEAVREYGRLTRALAREGLDVTLSVKPTLMGLGIGEEVAARNLDMVFAAAARESMLVQIDMEDSTTTDATLRLHRRMQERHGNAAAVLQASLRRTSGDVSMLPGGSVVRLCKGIYLEDESLQFQDPDRVRGSFVEVLGDLFEAGHFAGIATHDDALVEAAEGIVERSALGTDRYEFQMLLGVRPQLRSRLLGSGHPVRVYVPYGRDWQAYSIRRLRENPRIARHVLRGLLTPWGTPRP
jgi:proline dehydrogenase